MLTRMRKILPAPAHTFLSILSAGLLLLAFPGFEFWPIAWFALVPLFFAVQREKDSPFGSFVLGWTFGVIFFFGSCWWLTHAPVTYAGFPPPLAYFLLFCAASVVALFPAVFAGFLAVVLKRFGNYGILAAPFLWTAVEFLRFWTTGNNWNAIAYSQAFQPYFLTTASLGGIYLSGFLIAAFNTGLAFQFIGKSKNEKLFKLKNLLALGYFFPGIFLPLFLAQNHVSQISESPRSNIIAIQPNVPMSGLTEEKWLSLRKQHVAQAESALQKLDEQRTTNNEQPTTVIFPESPMNFMYERDAEFQKFIGDFARRNNVSVLFNAAEPDVENRLFFNSAVMVNNEGRKVAQYDKIYLVPFGESVPAPLQNIIPALVGSFSYGKEYDLLPFGAGATGGVMICFESHFPNLSREYVLRGADVLVEMTNDGYLGNTPVLRQHLANAVFRAVETGRPVVRATNVGVTAFINERGEVLDAAGVYTEASRTWQISKSNGRQTFYVKYGDWFAWVCVIASFGVLLFAFRRRKNPSVQ